VVHAQFHVAPCLDKGLALFGFAAGYWRWRPDAAELGLGSDEGDGLRVEIHSDPESFRLRRFPRQWTARSRRSGARG
jgi:hypothetical protein